MYKTIISIILWPIWYLFFIPSLILMYFLIYVVPKKYYHFFIRPCCWIYCLLAGQWLNKENDIPSTDGQPYLYLFNHVSMFDQFMIGAYIKHHISAVGAKEIFKYPVFGNLIKSYGAIPIIRSRLNSAINSLSLVEEAINQGVSFIIAPEGTRTKTGELGSFKKGPFHLAKNTGITIVPIALIGGFRAKKKIDWRLKPGFLTTRFGLPVKKNEYENLSVDEISALIKKKIQKLIEGEIV